MKRINDYKKFTIISFLFIFLQASPQSSKKEMQKLVDENLQLAVKQYKHMQKLLPVDKLPRSYDSVKNELIVSGTDWWCSGFYAVLYGIYMNTQKMKT
jgi:hypothetical protein